MLKGGYQIIDLKNKELESGVGMVYEGIYDKIEGTRKAILISGLNVDGTEYHDCFAQPIVDGSNYTFEVYGKTITVSDVDVVVVSGSKKFYVSKEGTKYEFNVDEGMTWSEFVSSDYNTEGLAASGSEVTFGSMYYVQKDNTNVKPTDVIIVDNEYTTTFEN